MNRKQTIAAFITALVIGAALGTALPAIARSTGVTLPADSGSCSRDAANGGTACTADCDSAASAPSAGTTATCTDGACGSSACQPAPANPAPSAGGCPDCQ